MRITLVASVAGVIAGALTVQAQTTVTTSSPTSSNQVPVFSSDSSVTNSSITVLSTGNVGIGTTNPQVALQVAGPVLSNNAFISSLATFSDVSQTAYYYGLTWADFSNGISGPSAMLSGYGGVNLYSGGVRRFTLDPGGNVGIGTTGPMAKLQISGTGQVPSLSSETGLLLVSGSPSQELAIGADSNSPWDIWLQGKRASSDGTSWPLALNPLGGKVGIGTTSPSQLLEVNGTAQIDGALNVGTAGIVFPSSSTPQTTPWTGVLCGGDYAEAMNAAGGKAKYEPGDVLVLASEDSGDVQKSGEPYSTMVAGIVATKPGVVGLRATIAKLSDNVPMAMVGVVPTKVSAENGPIRRGDLLVTSSNPGYAMRGTDRSRLVGAVIGKAMGSLNSGTGVIEVLVTLQ